MNPNFIVYFGSYIYRLITRILQTKFRKIKHMFLLIETNKENILERSRECYLNIIYFSELKFYYLFRKLYISVSYDNISNQVPKNIMMILTILSMEKKK